MVADLDGRQMVCELLSFVDLQPPFLGEIVELLFILRFSTINRKAVEKERANKKHSELREGERHRSVPLHQPWPPKAT